MQQVNAKLTFFILKAISWLPFPLIYFLSDVLFVVFYHITGYRKEVVFGNIKNTFPEKSEQEIEAIGREFYHHLCDVILESVKSFSISEQEVIRRVEMQQISLLDQYRAAGRSVIVVFGHNSNWEWLGLSSSAQIHPEVFALYRKIKNPVLNELIRNNRGRFGLGLIGEREAYKMVEPALKTKEHWSLVGFLADQSANPKRGIWLDFFNQKTIFVKGPALYGKKTNSPIIFFDLRKIKRGYYKGHFETLVEYPANNTEEEIMQAFATRLEKQIKEQPAYWLWSHKRWKHKYSG